MSLWREEFDEKELEEVMESAMNKKAMEVFDVLKRFSDIKFEEGDFLLRYDCMYNRVDGEWKQNWEVEKFSETNDSPRKYKVVHVDKATGLPFVQKVLFNGEMSGEAKCLAGYDLDSTKFLPDPDFIDHHLLAEEEDQFDPLQVYKEKRVKRKVKNGI